MFEQHVSVQSEDGRDQKGSLQENLKQMFSTKFGRVDEKDERNVLSFLHLHCNVLLFLRQLSVTIS